jgi:hypothetical protein
MVRPMRARGRAAYARRQTRAARGAAFAIILGLLACKPAPAVPSFARQTGMTCAACHTVFPELTPFGREFKLNGYVLDNMKQIKGITPEKHETLSLNAVPPLSLMLQISDTHTRAPVPDSVVSGAQAKSDDLLFPQQASIFYAGKIAENFGGFVQLTYDGAADHFGFDNTDLRYARQIAPADAADTSGKTRNWIIGVTANNNPTVQDVWNSTQAWGFPYAASSTAPSPVASTKLDTAGIGQSAAGLGIYTWWNQHLYAEFTAYGASLHGGVHPLDSTQSQVIEGAAPYWRVGWEQRWRQQSLFVGTYGINARMRPGAGTPLAGPVDRFTDAAADMQYQFIGEQHMFSVLSTYISEKQRLDSSIAAGFAQNATNDLKTFKLAAEYTYRRRIASSLGYFSTSGSADALLYPAGVSVTGSATHSPDSRGYIGEVDFLPWLNTKFQLQYTGYSKFNGGRANYDGLGRSAADNNSVYLLAWLYY